MVWQSAMVCAAGEQEQGGERCKVNDRSEKNKLLTIHTVKNIIFVPILKMLSSNYMKKIILAGILMLFFVLDTTAQTTQLTPQQMKQLQQLTPEQMGAIQKQQMQSQGQKETTNNKLPKMGYTTDKVTEVDYTYSRDTIALTYEDYYKKRLQNMRDSVKVFGRELFSQKNLTFAPSLNLPTPENYILASGDQLNISVWGAAQEDYKVEVSPDGYINLSGIGLISVGGQSIRSAEKSIKSRLLQRVEGITDGSVFVNISLGNIRSIKVNIAGEALVPGTYTLPSLATLFNAMYVSGGVSEIGSVRDIRLYRKGKLISSLDVYDYLLKGKLDIDIRLEDNDLIVVQPYINLVKVSGEVKRPMIYEMKGTETLEELVTYTGGFTGLAYNDNVSVTRSATGRDMQFFTVDKPGYSYFHLMDKDSVAVGKVTAIFANRVSVTGPVWRPGNYELSDKMNSVKKLVQAAKGPMENAFLGRAQLIRTRDDQTKEMISVSLKDLMNDINADVELIKNDSLVITAYDSLFQKRTLSIYGEVNDTMTFEYVDGMTLSDIIMKAGGFKESASFARIEVARRVTNPQATAPSPRIAEPFTFKITGDLALTPQSQTFKLMPFDQVYVRRSPGYIEQKSVYVEGEVIFDGTYVLSANNVSLTQIIEKAGGFTPEANISGAYLRRQKTEFDIERDRSVDKLLDSGKRTAKDTIMVEQIEVGDYYSVAIDLQAAINYPGGLSDVLLKEGDKLVVPTFSNTVKISGGVYYPNTVTYDPKAKVRNYIAMAGGYNQRARKTPFVIYQNGMVSVGNSKVQPGCEIVIPQKPERKGMSPGEWMSIGTSVISMAAMITSIFK